MKCMCSLSPQQWIRIHSLSSELKDRIYNVSICCIVHDQILLESDRLIELYSLYNESFSVVGTLLLEMFELQILEWKI